MKPCAVYYLVDPVTREPRYVGVSVSPLRRYLERHLGVDANNHKDVWIRKLKSQGLKPELVIKCWTSEEDARRIEIALIAKLPNLTNCTAGGDGLNSPSGEIRKKMSDSCTKGWAKRQGVPTAKKGKTWSEAKREAFESRKQTGSWKKREYRPWSEARREKYLTNPPTWKCSKPSPLKGRPSSLKGKPWSDARRAAQERLN